MKHLFSSILWKLQIIPSLVIFFLMVGIATVNIQFLQINDIENNNLTNNLTNDIVIHTFLIVMAMIFVFFINLKVNAKILNPIKQISDEVNVISSGDLSARITLKNQSLEFNELIENLNESFDGLETAFKRQAQFTEDVSHELRTPITILVSQTQNALALPRSKDDHLNTIKACEQASLRMEETVESLLTLSRIQASSHKVNIKMMSLDKMVCDILDSLVPLAKEKNITIFQDIDCDDFKVNSIVESAIQNIVCNAIYYSNEKGEIHVTVKKDQPLNQQSNQYIIAVKDNGIGILERKLPCIFDRFYRADQSRSRLSGSSGLGLAIAREAIESLNGTISVSSELGVGSEFIIRIS